MPTVLADVILQKKERDEEEKSLREVGQASSSEPSVQSLYPSQTQLFTMQAPLLQRK